MMWAEILWEYAAVAVGAVAGVELLGIVSRLGLPWWTRRRYERAKARQIRREIEVMLEAQAVRAAQRARMELAQQVERRKGER